MWKVIHSACPESCRETNTFCLCLNDSSRHLEIWDPQILPLKWARAIVKRTLLFPVLAPEAERPKWPGPCSTFVRKYAFRRNCEFLLYPAFISNNKDDLFFSLAGIILSCDEENGNNHIQPQGSIRLPKLIDFPEKQIMHIHWEMMGWRRAPVTPSLTKEPLAAHSCSRREESFSFGSLAVDRLPILRGWSTPMHIWAALFERNELFKK